MNPGSHTHWPLSQRAFAPQVTLQPPVEPLLLLLVLDDVVEPAPLELLELLELLAALELALDDVLPVELELLELLLLEAPDVEDALLVALLELAVEDPVDEVPPVLVEALPVLLPLLLAEVVGGAMTRASQPARAAIHAARMARYRTGMAPY